MRSFRAVAISAVAIASLALPGLVSAHAPITSVMWDSTESPSKVIAGSGENPIDPTAGTFYLRVYAAAGVRVDLDDAAVGTPRNTISVSVQPGLAPGAYRVDWKTLSDDGKELEGSIDLVLGEGDGTASASGDHDHGDGATGDHDDAATDDLGDEAHEEASSCDLDHPLSWTIDDITGANVVPEPVDSSVYGTLHLTFDPATDELAYNLAIHGVSANLVTGAHVHYGGRDEAGHEHVFDFFNGQQLGAEGAVELDDRGVEALCTGDMYVNLHTVDYPAGGARAQLQLPEHGHADEGDSITPPSTGDAGLAQSEGQGVTALFVIVAGVALVALATGRKLYASKRA